MKKKLLVSIVATFGILALVACGGYQAPKPTATTAPSKPGEIAVTAGYPKFQPSSMTASKGQVVQLKITATDMGHTFTVDELGVNITVGRGQTIPYQLRAEKTGSFTFYCAVPGHRAAGMEGTIKVTE